ncbi:MAG: universal protein YeaZ [Ferruginibacter sp.]|nr:universal protein YeaZ [Ferruginibacter sp.]
MALILNIDSATETASVSIAENGNIIDQRINPLQKEHASFLHPAVEELLQNHGILLKDIQAIAVTIGPGSYTGLRVGMASAKGFAYALGLPLITIGTLPAMASAAIEISQSEDSLYCPLIDARRMEVYTAVYNHKLEEVISPSAQILTAESFQEIVEKQPVYFFGSGMKKWKEIVRHNNVNFLENFNLPKAISQLAFEKYSRKEFSHLAHTQPLYLKEFYTGD